jgi:hypothetical protein
MFFVLAMQVLSAMMQKAVEEQIFSPLPGINALQACRLMQMMWFCLSVRTYRICMR